MKTTLEVEITAADCADGVRNNERLCVVATAIARLQPEANKIEVNVNTIRYSIKENDKTFRLAYATPAAVRDYIRDFDAGSEAKPMKFIITAPQIVEKKPTPKGKAVTPSFKPSSPAKTRRSVRVFGEKSFQAT